MTKIFIKPSNPAIKVRKLKGGHLSELGEYVPRDTYYLRRIKDGDAVLVTDEKQIKQALSKAKTTAKKAADTQTPTDKGA